MLFLGRYGYITYKTNGYASRFPNTEYIQEINEKFQKSSNICRNIFFDEITKATCRFSGKIEIAKSALIGDSHARHLLYGFIYNKQDALLFWSAGMPPYIDIYNARNSIEIEKRKPKINLINKGFEYIANNKNINTVILSHRPARTYIRCIDIRHPDIIDNNIVLENGMRRTFDFLKNHNKKVIVILDNPLLPFNPEKCVNRNIPFIKTNNKCQFSRRLHDENKYINWYKKILLKVIKEYPDIKLFDMTDLLCDDHHCYVSKNGKILYRDRHHLSIDGSIYVSESLLKLVNE